MFRELALSAGVQLWLWWCPLPVAIDVNEAQSLQVHDTTTERTVILWNSKL